MHRQKSPCSLLSEDLGRSALHLLSGVERVSCVQMSLVYRKSTKSIARKYERSPGMEPNVGGVTHMTVINPGHPRSNPFQWIRGTPRGRHAHVSPTYRTMKGSRRWAEKHAAESSGAKLVAVDEYGTILTRPMSRKQVLRNTGRSSMAYNLSALRSAMRRNAKFSPSGPQATMAGMSKAQRRRVSKGLSKLGPTYGQWKKPKSRRRSKKHSGTKVRGGRVTAKAVSKRSASKKKATAKGASKAAKSASKQASAAKKAASKAKKATSKKAASKAAKSARSHASKAKKAAAKATSKAKKAKPSSKKAANKAAAKARREAAKAVAAANAAAKASKTAQRRGRLSRRVGKFALTSKAYGKYKGRVKGWSASPFRTGRLFNPPYIHVTSKHPKRRAAGIRMTANMLGRISQRKGLPHGQRVQLVEFGPRSKRKGYAVYVPGHVSERAYVRRFHFGGAAADAHSRALRSGYSKKRYSKKRGGSVSANGRSSMRRNSKKRHSRHSKRRVSRNGRRSKRRSSRRVHSNRYVVVKNGRRRRLRRNMTIFGVDPIRQVALPGAYAVGGLMVANAAANAAAAMPAITNVLDAGRADPIVTKSLVGAGVAGLAIAFGGKLPSMLRDNLGPIVAGMGCAVAVRLLRSTQASPYLGGWGAGFGEYVDQPLGAYVQDPSMGEYVDQPLGEYVDQPLGGLGTMYAAAGYPEGVDPADQDSVDGLMDVMEAAAGVGAFEAAAGMGTLYAAAGLGADAGTTGVVGSPIALPTYTPPRGPGGLQQPPFVSTVDPIDMARGVTGVMRRDLPIKTGIVTSEGRGSAGGIFSRSIFGGMMS